MADNAADQHAHDWDWFFGRWRVEHRRLTERLAGATDWETFGGRCTAWPTLGGAGNVDDNLVELPGGAYRAMTIRAYDAATGRWAIWWLDARNPHTIEPPVYGAFANGVGLFVGDDTFRGRPIRVRFRWTDIHTGTPLWDQAFSADGGATWETNWVMRFVRDD